MPDEWETIKINPDNLIGNVEERFDQLGPGRTEFHWMSFYNGWIEGRIALLGDNIKENRCDTCKFEDKFANKHITREPYICTRDAEGPTTIEGCKTVTYVERAEICLNGCPFWASL
jgi:hypothetical protein